jgi:hypothetical protein
VALPAAGGLVLAGLLGGLAYGLLLRVPRADVARLADRRFGLHDRLATALELRLRRDTSPLAAFVIRDADAQVGGLDLRRAVPWRWPREARLIPIPVLALAALPYLPPLPVPEELLPPLTPAEEKEQKDEKAGAPQVAERPIAKKTEQAQRVELQERSTSSGRTRRASRPRGTWLRCSRTRAWPRSARLLQLPQAGDERLRMLERTDSPPDLQRDFTQTPTR